LSVQQILDCNTNCYGCNGCNYDPIYKYITAHGIFSETDYPYKSGGGSNFACKNVTGTIYRITGHTNIASNDVQTIKSVLATQSAIATIIDASDIGFEYYSSGIFTSKTCQAAAANHVIALIGFGHTFDANSQSIGWWLLKNFYGTTWGESGFARIASQPGDMCGITSRCRYVF